MEKKKLRLKVPSILQMEALECGAASLAMVLAYYGKWVPLSQVRDQMGISRDGVSAKGIADSARFYGMEVKSYRLFFSKLRQQAEFPCIAYWDRRHFVVITGYDENFIYVNDPEYGPCKFSNDDFRKHFSNLVICCTPNDSFVADGKPASVLSFVRKRLNGTRSVIAFIVLAGLIGAVFSSITPKVSEIFIDKVLSNGGTQLAPILLGVLTVTALLQLVLSAAQASYLTAANGRFDMESSENFIIKLLRLPMRFYSQRTAGDLLLRQSSNSQVSNTLISTVAPIAVCAVSLVIYLALMLSISIPLALVGIVTTLLNVVLGAYISKQRLQIFRTMARDSGKLSGLTSGIVNMIDTVKASGREQDYFAMWTGEQAAVAANQAKASRINCYLGPIPSFLISLANAVVLLLGLVLILDGQLTAGSLVAMQTLVSLFTGPAQSLIQSGQVIQEMRTDMERIEDVMGYQDDVIFTQTTEHQQNPCIEGSICVQQLSFGYSKQSDPLLENFNMELKPGQQVALVGGSGSGKSTVAKLVAGLYQPWSGEIFYDGRTLFDYSREAFTSSAAMVDQDIVIFKGTFNDAIRFGNPHATQEDVVRAAKDAQIYATIMARGGFECALGEGGQELSGGQRQQLEIARALAGNPAVLILDEATSALDAQTESLVMDAVKARGMAMIVVAHRLSTVCDADEIIVLEKGRVVERGTHDQLIALQGSYYHLVSAY